MTGERIRDKIAASKCKGMWMGGCIPLGYDLKDRHPIVNAGEAEQVRQIYRFYLEFGCVKRLKVHLDAHGTKSKVRVSLLGEIVLLSPRSLREKQATEEILVARIVISSIRNLQEFCLTADIVTDFCSDYFV